MADSNAPIPPEEEEVRRQRRSAYRRDGRWGWGWGGTWIWFWILIVILFGWFGGWGWGGHGGWWGERRAVVVQQPAQFENSPLAVLTAPSKSSYIGRTVTLERAEVQGSAGNGAWWVGPSNTRELLVVVPQDVQAKQAGGEKAALANGEFVTITGTVKKAPEGQAAQKEWSLSSDDASRLDEQGVYLEASQLTLNQQEQRSGS